MDDIKKQIVERIQSANNVLVTVSSNPTVDQLAAAIGLTLMLNKLGKHGTAVFSGTVPSTIEFLQPEKTIEKNTDSLRDFIIALDKSKADKLRYKVEDSHVKIFITPYRASISEADLDFSQGDFNVEVVVALGVTDPKDLDAAITAHGRILHDATVTSVNTHAGGQLGTINLIDEKASSLCEITANLAEQLKPDGFDEQISTAFLTGIVSETERFSNEKTTSVTMGVSAKLMANGANQQLVATKLDEPAPEPEPQVEPEPEQPPEPEKPPEAPPEPPEPEPEATEEELAVPEVSDTQPEENETEESENDQESEDQEPEDKSKTDADGTLEIDHGEGKEEETKHQINIDDQGNLHRLEDRQTSNKTEAPVPSNTPSTPKFVADPPISGGTLTANSRPEALDPTTDPLSLPPVSGPLLTHDNNNDPNEVENLTGAAPKTVPDPLFGNHDVGDDTLSDLEKSLGSPHAEASALEDGSNADEAREAIDHAMQAAPDTQPLPPIAALNAQPADLDLGHAASGDPQAVAPTGSNPLAPVDSSATPPPYNNSSTDDDSSSSSSAMVDDPTAPPPVPPPMMPPPQMDDNTSSDSKAQSI